MSSVPDLDPNPDPPDPHYLGLPDPDSLVRGVDPFIIKQNSKKNLDSYDLRLLLNFLSLKNNVNVHSKSNKQKNFFFQSVFC
jgi:hypothetical protein